MKETPEQETLFGGLRIYNQIRVGEELAHPVHYDRDSNSVHGNIFGGFASNVISSPVLGCGNCKCAEKRAVLQRLSPPPYLPSPSNGRAREENWARI